MQTLANKKNDSWLSWFLRGVLILGSLVLIARLFELQIIKGNYYRNLSEGNRITRVKIEATRGKILARGGEVLEGPDFSHLTGYLAETNEDEVGKIDPACIEKGPKKLGQLVGRGGLQEFYNCSLSGVDGEELIEVDSLGVKLRSLGIREPVAGIDLKTNIDFGLQKEIAENFNGNPGAVVATDKNGEVLALFSSPSFDPGNVAESLNDSKLPLFNRSIGGLFHPGSIFKPLVAIAALEEGVIDKNYKFNDTGVITVNTLYGNYSYSNWYFTQYGGKEGEIDLTKALARSTDTFFYTIGELTGIDNLVEWMKKFGLTRLTDIDIPGEILSLIPSPDWKLKIKNEKWFLGNTYHFSIGQGDLALTPVGIHRANLVVTSGGKLCSLKIVGNTICQKLKIKPENINLIKSGMKKACSTGGTGYTFFDFQEKHESIDVACKTGTAETNDDGKTHAWFTAFAPINNPEIMLTVMVEGGGEGSKVAGPIARKIMDYYFANK
jgi:penicillin-binding protein 2